MHNVCLECGRKFTADHHTNQCARCKAREDAMFANTPPRWEPRLSRWPSRDTVAPPAPMPLVVVPEQSPRINYEGGPCSADAAHGGPFVSRIGRRVLCHECAREADRVALRSA